MHCLISRHLACSLKPVHGLTRNSVRWMSSKLLQTQDPFYREGVSEVIDVRSPEEYNEDHIPGAINLPILSLEEFQIVGKLFSEAVDPTNPLKARLTGAKFSLANIIKIVDTHLMDKPLSYSPFIYCRRGGLRSRSLATVLAEIGFPVVVLEGGYKTYRRQVLEDLHEMPKTFQFNVVTGSNKSGKSLIMRKLIDRGHQVLNFDKMVKYEDLFLSGDLWKMKSRHRYMETKLRDKLVAFDPSRPVWVKHQLWHNDLMKRTNSIQYNIVTPSVIYKQMLQGRTFEVRVPNEEKVERLAREGYLTWMDDNMDIVESFLDTHAQVMYDYRILSVMQAHVRNGNMKEFMSVLLEEEHKIYKTMRKRCRRKFPKSRTNIHKPDFFVVNSLTEEHIVELVEQMSTS